MTLDGMKKTLSQMDVTAPIDNSIALGRQLRIPIWPFILVVSVGFGVLAALLGANSLAVVAAVAVLPIGLVFLHQMTLNLGLAPLIILFAALFLPFYVETGTQSVVVDGLIITILLAGTYLLRVFIVEKQFEAPYFSQKALLAFMAIVVISLVWSMLMSDPLIVRWQTFTLVQLATTVVMLMLAMVFFLVSNRVQSIGVFKAMVAMMVVAGVLGYFYDKEMIPLEINTQGLFTMWIVTISIGIAFFNRRMPLLARAFFLALGLAWMYHRFGIRITWVTGWLPAVVTLGVLTFSRSKKIFVFFVILVVILVILNADYLRGVLIAEQAESGDTRLNAWEINWSVTSQHFLFGTGPGGYAVYYMSYFPQMAMATHNNYVDILAQTGIVGTIAYLLFILPLAWLGYKLCVRLKGRRDFVEAMANVAFAGTVGCITAMMFGDWLLPFPYTQGIAAYDYAVYSWLFMGMTIALDRLTKDDKSLAALSPVG